MVTYIFFYMSERFWKKKVLLTKFHFFLDTVQNKAFCSQLKVRPEGVEVTENSVMLLWHQAL